MTYGCGKAPGKEHGQAGERIEVVCWSGSTVAENLAMDDDR